MQVMRDVNVRAVLNGFIVQVGCQTLVFNKIEEVAENLVAYQKNPEITEKRFAENAVNKTLDNGPQPEPVNMRLDQVRPATAAQGVGYGMTDGTTTCEGGSSLV